MCPAEQTRLNDSLPGPYGGLHIYGPEESVLSHIERQGHERRSFRKQALKQTSESCLSASLFASEKNTAATWLNSIENERKPSVLMTDEITESHGYKPASAVWSFSDSSPISSNGSLFILCLKANWAASRTSSEVMEA